jgi:hypothetical protein
MKKLILSHEYAVALLSCLLGACATSRSVIDIPTPSLTNATQQQATGKLVYINPPRDKRVFEASPASPNIPSLDPSEDGSDKIRARAIARKRNTFGKALGDILLPEGKTVESLTAASIRQAFLEKGYQVLDDKSKVSEGTFIVDAELTKFWSWTNPGFAAITLSAEISTQLDIKSPAGTNRQNVSVKASDNFQTGMESNWTEVINKVLKIYVDDLKQRLQ